MTALAAGEGHDEGQGRAVSDAQTAGDNRVERQRQLDAVAQQPFDLIVVGAGINGTGIARDAAMRGLRVLLVDKDDLGSGSTSYSTRLIHGGLRYLEYYELGLVRESLREREILLHIAPHLVRPIQLMIPFYRNGQRPPTLMRMGLTAYDVLSFDKSLANHKSLNRAATLRRVPALNPDGLRGAGVYSDAQVEYAERLCVENALSAASLGAVVLTHVRVDRLLLTGGAVQGVEFSDAITGRTVQAHAPLTMNVTGAWVDELLGELEPAGQHMIGATKGSHIIVGEFPGAPSTSLYFESAADGRPMFILPWQEHLYLIGTTDLRFSGDLDNVVADSEEIRYLLNEANRLIVGAALTEKSVLFSYSGVRPLPYSPEGTPEAKVTRRHIIYDHAPATNGLLSIIGGKLTTYRSLAEQTVDLALRKLGRPRRRCATGVVPLPGGVGNLNRLAEWLITDRNVDPAVATRLVHIYGARAADVVRIADRDPALRQRLGETVPALAAEIVFAVEQEMAQSLDDVFLRRTMLGLSATQGSEVISAAADIAQRYLGWSESQAQREVEIYNAALARFAVAVQATPAG
ncbi:MAG: glycerol-3-phosphate dehydrogenase [Thermoleophilia bacterium]